MMCGKWVAAKKRLGCLSAAMALGLWLLAAASFWGIMALPEAAGATAKICDACLGMQVQARDDRGHDATPCAKPP